MDASPSTHPDLPPQRTYAATRARAALANGVFGLPIGRMADDDAQSGHTPQHHVPDVQACPDPSVRGTVGQVACVLAGLQPSGGVREALGEDADSVSFEPTLAPPCATGFLRLETATGWPLDDPRLLAAHWHRAPFVLPIRLVRYAPQSALREILDSATIGTRGDRDVFQRRLERIATLLVRGWLRGSNGGEWNTDPDGLFAEAVPRGVSGRLDRFRARWHDRTHVEWWSLGSTPVSLAGVVRTGRLGTVAWLAPNKAASYLADPFPWPGTGKLLCEEMPVRGGKGRIIAIDPACPDTWPGGATGPMPILETDQHHSYPNVFQDNVATWLLPEATRFGSTTLYRLTAGGTPVFACAVAPERRLADPTLFHHAGRYWIACTDLDIGEHDNLCLLHAERPEGPWVPHRRWPVRIDIRGARPAGALFDIDGQLHRPGQDCTTTYGGGIAIHRIDLLTPDAFRETLVRVLRPDPDGPFPDGLHTIVHDGARCWVDGKRLVLDPASIMHRLLRRLRLYATRSPAA
jgi:hypothetical protein